MAPNNPSDLLRGLPGYTPQSGRVGGDNPQTLTAAQVSGNVPSIAGRFFDQLNAGPTALGIREEALLDARKKIENEPSAIILAEQIAMGIRTGLATNGTLAFDPNIEWANARAIPFDLHVRGVIVPPSPDAEQTASADLIEEANRNPVSFAAGASILEEWIRIEGSGEALGLDVEAGKVAVIDQIGVSSWSLQAEFELLWALGVGFAQTGDALLAQNARLMLWPPRRGFPFGADDAPGSPNGLGRLSHGAGSPSNTVRLSLMVRFMSSTTPIKSTPHYFEATLRGWKVPMGRDNRPVSAGIGGADVSAPSPERT